MVLLVLVFVPLRWPPQDILATLFQRATRVYRRTPTPSGRLLQRRETTILGVVTADVD